MNKFTLPMRVLHVDILRGLHPAHILRKHGLTVREFSTELGQMVGVTYRTESPSSRGAAWWRSYFRAKGTLTF